MELLIQMFKIHLWKSLFFYLWFEMLHFYVLNSFIELFDTPNKSALFWLQFILNIIFRFCRVELLKDFLKFLKCQWKKSPWNFDLYYAICTIAWRRKVQHQILLFRNHSVEYGSIMTPQNSFKVCQYILRKSKRIIPLL